MRAIIDLGTNTFHLLIAEVKNNEIIVAYKLQVPVKLGEGGISNSIITPEAYKRGLLAMEQFHQLISNFKVNEVSAFATSAIRSAKNGLEFIDEIYNKFNIRISQIHGDQEALFIYNGVINSFEALDEDTLVLDIGGGSVEFILGRKETIIWKQSFDIGTARLLSEFKLSDPLTEENKTILENYFNQKLAPLENILAENPANVLVGAAGSFDTLVDVVMKDFQTIPISLSRHAYEIPISIFSIYYELIVSSNSEQRKALRGMAEFRQEMIVVASFLMNFIIKKYNIQKLIASSYSLKEGVMFSQIASS